MRLTIKRLASVGLVCLLVIVAYFLGIKAGPSDGAGKTVSEEQLLTSPNMPIESVLVWANEAAVAILSLNYVDYRKQQQDSLEYFTADGWKVFQEAFTKSGILDDLIKDKLIASAVATGAPIILDKGVQDGFFTWKVQIPMLLTYIGPNKSIKQNLMVTITLRRTVKFVGKRGLGVVSFVSKVEPAVAS